MSSAYVLGEVVRLLLNTFDFAGAVADPGAVVLKVKQPDGTVVTHTPAVVRDSAGVYRRGEPMTKAQLLAVGSTAGLCPGDGNGERT